MRLWSYVRSLMGGRQVAEREARERRAWDRRIKSIAFERYELQEIEREEREAGSVRQVERLEPRAHKSVGFGSVRMFVADTLTLDPRERIKVSAVYAAYTAWCNERRFPPATIAKFADEFERHCTARAVDIRPADGGIYCFGMRFAA